jgi:hypothetical protein
MCAYSCMQKERSVASGAAAAICAALAVLQTAQDVCQRPCCYCFHHRARPAVYSCRYVCVLDACETLLPAPSLAFPLCCPPAVEVRVERTPDDPLDVLCSECGTTFCFNCKEEAHRPVSGGDPAAGGWDAGWGEQRARRPAISTCCSLALSQQPPTCLATHPPLYSSWWLSDHSISWLPPPSAYPYPRWRAPRCASG